jgi:hypothetical protein
MSARVRLGDWTCPSGNNVVAFVEPDTGDGVRRVALAWDNPPPLGAADLVYYLAVILPAVTRRAQEYLERPGRALAVVL